jgi:hypothetical protein
MDDYFSGVAEELLSVLAPGVLENDGMPAVPEGTQGCGTTLSAVLVTAPAEGTFSLNSDGSFTFETELEGEYSFTYMACDDVGSCSTAATVTISIAKKPGQVRFVQERGKPQSGPAGWDEWTQPAGAGTGGFVGSPDEGALQPDQFSWATSWQTPTASATSWLEVDFAGGAGGVCNSNGNPQPPWTDSSGTLTAWLKGTPGSTYDVELMVTVAVSAPGGVSVIASVVDYTSTGDPPSSGGHNGNVTWGTTLGYYHDSWTGTVTASATDTATQPKGTAKIVRITPTVAGSGAPGQVSFSATIDVLSIA